MIFNLLVPAQGILLIKAVCVRSVLIYRLIRECVSLYGVNICVPVVFIQGGFFPFFFIIIIIPVYMDECLCLESKRKVVGETNFCITVQVIPFL